MGNRGWEGKREKGNGGWEVGVEVEEKGRRERKVGVEGKRRWKEKEGGGEGGEKVGWMKKLNGDC